MSDIFHTISTIGRGQYTEQRSRFLSFAHHCQSADEAKPIIERYARDYHDARHVCWGYRIGSGDDEIIASSDNGEPSGTAGRPIVGQLRSADLTDIVVVVVRYFGGIKLGTSGLIVAYREATRLAIESAHIITGFREDSLAFKFPYMAMNDVMKIVKGYQEIKVREQAFDNSCSMTISVRLELFDEIKQRLLNVDGVTLSE